MVEMNSRDTQGERTEALFRWGVRLEWFTISWNVIEAFIAVGAGILAGSTALVAFGADSSIEVISAVVLLWRLKKAGPNASRQEHGAAERQALYLVAGTFLLLAIYIAVKSTLALLNREQLESSMVGLVLSIVSLIVMPVLAYSKGQIGKRLDSKALQADAVETWVCSYLSLTLLAGVGLNYAL
ncbi:MAG: cation transporter, partial [Planctomycetaceae bacterium]|nr:cation transporter [Planctomycetaceae bacterium]